MQGISKVKHNFYSLKKKAKYELFRVSTCERSNEYLKALKFVAGSDKDEVKSVSFVFEL